MAARSAGCPRVEPSRRLSERAAPSSRGPSIDAWLRSGEPLREFCLSFFPAARGRGNRVAVSARAHVRTPGKGRAMLIGQASDATAFYGQLHFTR